MFCKKCGTELPDWMGFCEKCGANLASPINTDTAKKYGKCLLTILRKKNTGRMKINIEVHIDGTLVKELSDGEIFSLVLDNGKHELFCRYRYMAGLVNTPSFEFIGDDNEIGYFLEYPLSSGAMRLDVHKERETWSGYYKGGPSDGLLEHLCISYR